MSSFSEKQRQVLVYMFPYKVIVYNTRFIQTFLDIY